VGIRKKKEGFDPCDDTEEKSAEGTAEEEKGLGIAWI
jgi:hypothetical protein